MGPALSPIRFAPPFKVTNTIVGEPRCAQSFGENGGDDEELLDHLQTSRSVYLSLETDRTRRELLQAQIMPDLEFDDIQILKYFIFTPKNNK